MSKKIKGIIFFMIIALSCVLITTAGSFAQDAQKISLVGCFQFDITGASIHEGSLKTDGIFIDFFLTRGETGKNFRVKIQADSGRVESFAPAAELKLEPPVSSEETYLKRGGANIPTDVVFACDGPVTAAAELKLGGKKFYAVIALDQALYVFPAPSKKPGKILPAFKTYFAEEPKEIFVSGDQIFVITDKFLSAFRIISGDSGRTPRLSIESETSVTPTQSLKKNIKLLQETNGYNFDVKYLSSDFFRFHKMAAAENSSSKTPVLAYFTGSFGGGNRNIYSLGPDFAITKISNFSGIISDFKVTDSIKPSFAIKHYKFENNGGEAGGTWIFTPPQSLSAPGEDPFDNPEPEEHAKLIAVSEINGERECLGVFAEGGGETETLKLRKTNEKNERLKDISSFRLPAAPGDLRSPDFTAAISHNVKSPVFAYYAPRSSRVWIIDAITGHIIDGIYFNQRYGIVTSMKFLNGGDILAIKTEVFEGKDFTRSTSSALSVYRPEYKTLTEICRHRSITGYGYVRYNGSNHVILTFGKKRPEPDSLGVINIR